MQHLSPNPDKKTHFKHLCRISNVKCKFCGSNDVVRYGIQSGTQQYLCYACGRKFGEKDTLENRQIPTAQIGVALGLFFDGLSFAKISEQLKAIYSDEVDRSTIYHWVMRYSERALEIFKTYKPKVGNTWIVDETVIEAEGRNIWFFDIIDEDTRFLLASHLSYARTIYDVSVVMKKARYRAGKDPRYIISDGLIAYKEGIRQVFGKHAEHIRSRGFTSDINTNLIERFHGTLKERTKVIRGFKSLNTARTILNGFVINYNFFRPHITLENTTPAQEAGIKLPFSTWEGLLRFLQRKGEYVHRGIYHLST